MAEERPIPPPDLAQQLKMHAESFRAAGVEWLPQIVLAPPEKTHVETPPAKGAELSLPMAASAGPTLFAEPASRSASAPLTMEQRQAEMAAPPRACRGLRALQTIGRDANADGLRSRPARR